MQFNSRCFVMFQEKKAKNTINRSPRHPLFSQIGGFFVRFPSLDSAACHSKNFAQKKLP